MADNKKKYLIICKCGHHSYFHASNGDPRCSNCGTDLTLKLYDAVHTPTPKSSEASSQKT